jgi:hypothetical protein
MKKLSVLFVSLVALMSVVSCSKDDDNDSSTSIEGKWELVKEGETEATLETVDNGSCGGDMYEVLGNGTITSSGFYTNEESACTAFSSSAKWKKQGNMFIVTDGEEIIIAAEILEVNATTLKLKTTDEEGIWYEVYTRK